MIISAEVVALIAAAVAVFAAVLAVRATALVARTVMTTADHGGPPSRRRELTAEVADGKTRRTLNDDTREYSFDLVARNHTDAERQIRRVELRVQFRTRANFVGAVDLLSDQVVSIPSGATTNTTLHFTTSNVIPRHCRVDAYTLFLTDDRGERIVVEASLPAVLQADTDGVGPKSWGFD